MKKHYDIIVIGAGAGGLGVAIGMARFGFSVLLIDRDESNFGGECLNSGCIPSKALIHVAEIIKQSREAEAFGLKSSGKPDFAAVMNYVHSRQDIIRQHENAEYLKNEVGIDTLIGEASFSGKSEVEVKGERFSARKILVATGSRARKIEVEGMDQVQVLTNENLFELKELPQNLLIIGGGPIGVEMAQAFNRLGSNVTVLEAKDRLMGKDPKEASQIVKERLEQGGVNVKLRHTPEKFEKTKAFVRSEDGEVSDLKCDSVLLAIGREIDYKNLKLENASVKLKDGKPEIDSYLRARGNKKIVFAGDAARNMLFSHAAELHTSILLNNFFVPAPFKKKLNLKHFSWCTFTDPQVCTFGYSEEELGEKGINYDRIEHDFESDDRAVVSDYRYGKLLLYLKKNKLKPRDGKILGGTVIAPNAGEMAQELILANEQGLGAGAIFNKTYPYPVQSRAHKIALVEKFSEGISPSVKRLLKFLYR